MQKYQNGGDSKMQAPGKKRTLGGPKLYSTDSRKDCQYETLQTSR